MKTVMLVDDNLIANFYMKQVICNCNESLRIDDYTDSKIALRILDEVNPTVIFLDINLPVLIGWQFLAGTVTRRNETTGYILTSSTSDQVRQRSTAFTNVVSLLSKLLA